MFREGMGLVEQSAAYLDGPGRDESRALGREAALGYASESMRLTTRLMQIASWLLVHRALAEGEITPSQAAAQKRRLRLTSQEPANAPAALAAMPARLRELVALSVRFHARVLHLEALLGGEPPKPAGRDNPIAAQRSLIQDAFARIERRNGATEIRPTC
jgi:regulator of CtrA degradation